jgi:hypothetical protein
LLSGGAGVGFTDGYAPDGDGATQAIGGGDQAGEDLSSF